MRLLPRLIDKAHELGFEIRGGDLFRDPRLHGSSATLRFFVDSASVPVTTNDLKIIKLYSPE